jgi:flagellar hook-associated protein 1 FlgK
MSTSLFYGIEIARRGIYASQTALNVIGHNVSNADTEGYTRQRVVTESVDPSQSGSRFAPLRGTKVGGGVSVQRIDQIRDQFIDREYRRENANTGMWETLTEQMGYIESMLNETGDTGISATLSTFFSNLSKLAQSTTSGEVRTTVQQSAINLTESFNHYYRQLTETRDGFNENVKTSVEEINNLLNNIAGYNRQIFSYELAGDSANDLRDKRNLLLDELSAMVDIEYHETNEGHLVVTVQGQEMVNHTSVNELTTTHDTTTGVDTVVFSKGGAVFNYGGGKLYAYTQLRDGDTADNMGVPYILESLNTLARTMAEEFNKINAAGWTLADDKNESRQGVNFFDDQGGDYSLVNAGNFKLSTELLESANNIACSTEKVILDNTAGSTQSGNNKNILAMLELVDSKTVPTVGGFESYLKSMVGRVGIESANCQTRYGGQLSVQGNLETRRQAVSSVSVDEEMISLIKTQRTYAAVSRVITTIDEALDVIINKTGTVGR